MSKRNHPRSNPNFLLFVILLILCSCKSGGPIGNTDLAQPEESSLSFNYPIDPIFQEFYEFLGGESVLGPAIAPLQESGNLKTQYVEAGLMVYDPMAVEGERYQLAPLGLSFGVTEPPVPDPGQPNLRYINGHIIDPDFLSFYEKLGGARFVGRPLTEARHNPEKGRIEQYFENLGFYRLEQDVTNKVFLMAYGVFACGARCRYHAIEASIPSQKPLLPEPFASTVARLGLSFVGRTLSEPYINSDGNVEVIFENIVLVYPSLHNDLEKQTTIPPAWLPITLEENSITRGEGASITFSLWFPQVVMSNSERTQNYGESLQTRVVLPLVINEVRFTEAGQPIQQQQVSALPLVELLGVVFQPPVPPSGDPLMIFHPTDGHLGHNVPLIFQAYLEQHGGISISGPPTSEVFTISEGKFRQCFKNICLDYDLNAPEDERLHPVPLGKIYKERFYRPTSEFDFGNLKVYFRIHTWEGKSFVASNEIQEIHVGIFEGETPLKNREPILILTLPDGSQQTRTFPPTDESGHSYLTIPGIAAPNGTLIAYKVCINDISSEEQCVGDNYLIWNYP